MITRSVCILNQSIYWIGIPCDKTMDLVEVKITASLQGVNRWPNKWFSQYLVQILIELEPDLTENPSHWMTS